MPRRSTLTLAERESLFAVPTDEVELIRRYAFSEQELSVIQQDALRKYGQPFDENLLQHLSPLGLGAHQFDRGLCLAAEQSPTPLILGIATLGTPEAPPDCDCAAAASGSIAMRKGIMNFIG